LEAIRGKLKLTLDAATLRASASGHDDVRLDIGTGDGRYVLHTARNCPQSLVVGLDACRENLRHGSRKAPPNAVFVIANALALPEGLHGLASRITINFPWGSLLSGLLDADPALMAGLSAVALPGASLEVRLNVGALIEVGWEARAGAASVRRNLRAHGFEAGPPARLDSRELRAYPTTWAKRLARGREPHALLLRATRVGAPAECEDAPRPSVGGRIAAPGPLRPDEPSGGRPARKRCVVGLLCEGDSPR
jgi:16S rRNA (adenine(1408)-N(1))-methyltransferase